MSADTIVPNPANPQNLNRYSYVNNNPLRYVDPSGHMQCEDYQGSCVSENQVTKINKAKQEKIRQKSIKKNMRRDGNTVVDMHVIIPTTTATQSINLLLTPQRCTSDPCIYNSIPSATPTATSTPFNVLATAGAELDIAANTAVAAGVQYCMSPPADCGQTAEKAFPQLSPWGSALDAGIDTKNHVDNIPRGQATPQEKIISYGAGGLAIPTAVIPLLIFFLTGL